MPPPTETIRLARQPRRNPHAAVSRHDFESDVEHAIRDGIAVEIRHLDAGDEEDGEDEPPEIVRELAAHLLADELRAGAGRGRGRGGEGPAEGLCAEGESAFECAH